MNNDTNVDRTSDGNVPRRIRGRRFGRNLRGRGGRRIEESSNNSKPNNSGNYDFESDDRDNFGNDRSSNQNTKGNNQGNNYNQHQRFPKFSDSKEDFESDARNSLGNDRNSYQNSKGNNQGKNYNQHQRFPKFSDFKEDFESDARNSLRNDRNNYQNSKGNNQGKNYNQHQRFPKFSDPNEDLNGARDWDGNYRNTSVDLDEEYTKYRARYVKGRDFTLPLMGYYDFVEKYYPNEIPNDQKSNPSTNFCNDMGKEKEQNFNVPNTTKQVAVPIPNNNIKKENIEKEIVEIRQKTTEKNANIKKEHKPDVNLKTKEVIKPSKTSSTSDDGSSSSDGETVEKVKKLINLAVDTSVVEPMKKTLPKPQIKKEKASSSSDCSSETSDSESETLASSTKPEKKKIVVKSKEPALPKKNIENSKNLKPKEEEVICLGKLERFENLVDDEDSDSDQNIEKCLLCDKTGHTSFCCLMICRNCGDTYHNAKMCEKPPNLSRMLQVYMEFNMSQCCQYDPEKRFSYKNGNVQTELLPGIAPPILPYSTSSVISDFNISTNEFLPNRKRKRTPSEIFKSKKVAYDSDTSCSSLSTSASIRSRRRKKQIKKNSQGSSKTNEPNINSPFMPMPFNPLMAAAFSQMMGFNQSFPAANFSGKKDK